MANRGGKHDATGGAITGAVGTPPPPGAPIEQAQPVTQAWTDAASRLARVHEKELPAFAPKAEVTPEVARARAKDVAIARRTRPALAPAPGSIILTDAADPVNDAPAGNAKEIIGEMGKQILVAQDMQDAREAVHAIGAAAAAAGDAAQAVLLSAAPAVSATQPTNTHQPTTHQPTMTADQILSPPPPIVDRPPAVNSKLGQAARDLLNSRARVAQPAASATDSPSRGVPTSATDPGKKITGGFGEAIDQQYFPLDGNELREVILGLMDKLVVQIQNDLRFSMAAVYPRVSATVTIAVNGYMHDADFSIPKRAEHLRTSPEIAEKVGAAPVEITLENNIAEFSPDGESLTPPNTMRRQLGLQVPKKQRVATPTGWAVVDRTV